jgi:hypothetical protein
VVAGVVEGGAFRVVGGGATVVEVRRTDVVVVGIDVAPWGEICGESTCVVGVVVRAEAVIEKSITSSRSGLDHITSWVPQRGEVVRVIGVPPYRESCGLISGRKTQDHRRHRSAKRCSSTRSELGAL